MRCGVGGLLVWRSVGGQGVAGCWPLYRTSALAPVALQARRGWTVRAEAVEAPCGRPFGRTTATSGAPFVALRGIDDLKAGTLQQYQALCRRYGIPAFADVHCPDGSLVHGVRLLHRALTHASALTIHAFQDALPRCAPEQLRHHLYRRHNVGLEFVGDRVVNLCVTVHAAEVCARSPNALTASLVARQFAIVNAHVCNEHLARVACQLGLDRLLRRRLPPSPSVGESGALPVLAGAYEALVGAIFLEHGYDVAHRFVRQTLTADQPQQGAEPTWPSREATAAESSDEPVPAGDHAEPDRTSAATPMSPHPKEALERELRLWTHAARRDARQRRRGAVSEPADGQATATVPSAASPQPLEYQLVQEVGRLTDNSWFEVQLQVFGVAAARGSGRSIIVAEHDAARQVLQALGVSSPAAEAPYRLRPETLRPAALLAVLLQRVRGSEASACDAAAWRQATDGGDDAAARTVLHQMRRQFLQYKASYWRRRLDTTRPPPSELSTARLRPCIPHPASLPPGFIVEAARALHPSGVPTTPTPESLQWPAGLDYGTMAFLGHRCFALEAATRAFLDTEHDTAGGGGGDLHSRWAQLNGVERRRRLWPLARQLLRERGALNAAAVSSPQVSQDLLAVLGAACWFSGTYTVPAAFIAEVQQRLHAEERRQQRTGHPDAPAGDSDLKGGARQRAHG
ncbi:hypothetical protein CDCA_CDCA05G1621 [Cyanidium caldarium]|uniref:Uncharacterized protein n=1 Tax=Cyanidium caldarium TaxID=2771 RepID=A0AAV9ITU9_CYACA|nr:hypothetical protein CDCA_CDCA05G1621 [Cyanidium caldarium]